MLSTLFPPKSHPDDVNQSVAMIAKIVLITGLLAAIWSGYHLRNFARSSNFGETRGLMRYDSLALVASQVRNTSFDYRVDGKEYTSQNVVFGGRPFGAVPAEGPVTVYYDKTDPALAVLQKRPAEIVVIGLLFALASPFLARFLWMTYV